MKRRLVAGLAAVVAATATILTASGAAAATPDVQRPARRGVTSNANVPVEIQVDETQFKVVASFVGIGKQVYDCSAGGTFTFREPVAGLFPRAGFRRASTARARSGRASTARTWTARCGVPVASVVPIRPRISVAEARRRSDAGHDRRVQQRRFIQRLDTRGGVAPAGTCTAPKTVAVDYTANYVFWAK